MLALSIVTLAAVLAGMERGRSRRHAIECNHSQHTAVSQQGINTESSDSSPAALTRSTAEGNGQVKGVMEACTPPGSGAGGRTSSGAEGATGRRLEILVHNISHKDMVLSLRRTRRAAATPQQQPPSGEAISNVIDAVSCTQSFGGFVRNMRRHLHSLLR